MSFNAAAQASPLRRKPMRPLRSVKKDPLQNTAIWHRVLADGHTARGGETGSGAFYEAQEEAARRIAHRLHDESAQMLATIYLELADIARNCPDSTVLKINLVVEHLDGVREQLRGLSHELSPPILDQFGLMPALQSLANGVRDRSGVNMVVFGSIAALPRLVGAVLYRVVQEALSNVVRHAKATEAVVRLSIENNRIFCTVSDDGIGFKMPDQLPGTLNYALDGPVHGLGLAGIHERVTALKGLCRIASCRNGGMELKVEIPL
jgi:signal transduction histidine kinase